MTDPALKWVPVTTAQMNSLRTASEARQAKSEELKKIVTNLKKRERNKGVIKISEILDDPDNKTEEEEDDLPDEDAELGPRVKEGIQILADLIQLGR